MDDATLARAVAGLEIEVAQLRYLREPAPAAVHAGLVDALDDARSEVERRRIP